ncbi:MAG: transglutaminase-like cysteine peptidase, partial [Pseudomonadota bacterium]
MATRQPKPRPGIGRRRAGKLLLGTLAGLAATNVEPQVATANGGLLGSIEFKAGSLDGIPAWQRVRRKLKEEAEFIAACDRDVSACGSPRIVAWRAKIRSLDGLPLTTQLRELNLFLNQIVPYLTDDENFGQEDYWTTPLEFLRHAGDCEDYAIIKFTSL